MFHVVFAFIAEQAGTDTDVATKAFYDNHCDVVNAILDLTIIMDSMTTALPLPPKKKSWWAKIKRRLFFLFCCSEGDDDDDNDNNGGIWWVKAPKMFEEHWAAAEEQLVN